MASAVSSLLRDPRHYQIATLSALVMLGVFVFAFDMRAWHAAACVSSTVATQFIASRIIGQRFDARSPLIRGSIFSTLRILLWWCYRLA
jgi:hypothetical protein